MLMPPDGHPIFEIKRRGEQLFIIRGLDSNLKEMTLAPRSAILDVIARHAASQAADSVVRTQKLDNLLEAAKDDPGPHA
jgi:hypothetical protein